MLKSKHIHTDYATLHDTTPHDTATVYVFVQNKAPVILVFRTLYVCSIDAIPILRASAIPPFAFRAQHRHPLRINDIGSRLDETRSTGIMSRLLFR